MQKVALGLIWEDGADKVLESAREYCEIVPRVYVIDGREPGELYASLADPRLHYAPFRRKTSLGAALNRALCLAYEEQKSWLWIMDAYTRISREQLLYWSGKASHSKGLYRSEAAWETLNPFRRPPCGLLVSVGVARSLGGWNPVLPTHLVLDDFEERLRATGGSVEKAIKVQRIPGQPAPGPWEIGQGLWTRVRRRFFAPGIKSR